MKKNGRRIEYLLACFTASAAFLVYLRTLQNVFVNWDDNGYIYENPHIHAFNAAFLKWAFSSFYYANWHPLTWMSHAIDYAIWGLNPCGHHLSGIILHSINSFIAVVLVIRLIEAWEKIRVHSGKPSFLDPTGKLIAGTATGLLFALHPLHVESVAWASERKDVLCGLFFLLSILSYISYAAPLKECAARQKFWARFLGKQYLLALFFFALALMSKPMAVSLPLVLIILDWFPLGRIFSFASFWGSLTEKLPFIFLSGGASAIAILAQKKAGAIAPFTRVPAFARMAVAVRSLVLYLWKMILPLDLVPCYPYPMHISLLSVRFFFPTAFILAITALCIVLAGKKCGLWLACWSYFVITLLPVIGVIQVGGQSMADRYTYLPSLGPFIAAGVAAAWIWDKTGRRGRALKMAVGAGALLVVLSISYLTFVQIGVWRNSIVLWNYVIGQDPDTIPIAYISRGVAFSEIGRSAMAIADCSKAIALDPANPDAYDCRGIVFEKAGLMNSAISDYKKAISLKPSANYYYDLGEILAKTGQLYLAIANYEKAIVLAPSYFDAYNNLGIICVKTGRFNRALDDFNKAILLNPHASGALVNRGVVYIETGRTGLAAADFQRACGMGDKAGCQALRQIGPTWKGIY